MRNAALLLGIIGGVFAMFVGLFGFGYAQVSANHAELARAFGTFDNPDLIRASSFLSPLLAIAGAGMAKVRALWGGILMLLGGGLMYHAFGFNVFTMFPISFTILGGIFALAAGKPDEPKAHF